MSAVTDGAIIAENDVSMRALLRSVLGGTALQVFLAVDGAEAVALARQFTARLVLLDIGMPHLNGLQACHAIRKLPGYAAVPIIMLTAYDDPRMRAAAQDVGATLFLAKPLRPDVLLARLSEHVDLWHKAPHVAAPPLPGETLPLRDGRETLDILRNIERRF